MVRCLPAGGTPLVRKCLTCGTTQLLVCIFPQVRHLRTIYLPQVRHLRTTYLPQVGHLWYASVSLAAPRSSWYLFFRRWDTCVPFIFRRWDTLGTQVSHLRHHAALGTYFPAGETPAYQLSSAGGTPAYQLSSAGGTPAYHLSSAGETPAYQLSSAGETPAYQPAYQSTFKLAVVSWRISHG